MSLVTTLEPDLFIAIQKDSANHFFNILAEKYRKNDSSDVYDVINTSLLYMAAEGSTKCVTCLLNHSRFGQYVNINTQDIDGDTPLLLAIKQNHFQLAELFLTNCDVNICLRNRHGETALDVVCNKCYLPLINPLIDTKRIKRWTNVDMHQYQYSALLAAIEHNFAEGLNRMLNTDDEINEPFDVNINKDPWKGTPLHYAIDYNSLECFNVIMNYNPDIESLRESVQMTPLMLSTHLGHLYFVKCIVGAGALINRQTTECSTALTLACHFGFEDIADFLLENGADPNIQNTWGFTPLYMATDFPAILAKLLHHPNVDVNQRCGERHEAPLHLAAVVGGIESFHLLIQKGADLDTLTDFMETPLWLSLWKGHYDFARLCIELNCDVITPSNGCQVYLWKYTPLELALGENNIDMTFLLHCAGAELINYDYLVENEPGTFGSDKTISLFPRWVKIRPEILDFVSQNDNLHSGLKYIINTPRTLSNMCVINIRKNLRANGKKFFHKIDLLPLPNKVKLQLMFKQQH